jgi:hypothetical protein
MKDYNDTTIHKGYYSIMPANVRYDKNLLANAKILYSEITALCNEKGYCWASNNYFAELYGVSKTSISSWIASLKKGGYIKIEMFYEKGIRHIRITDDMAQENLKTPTRKLKDPLQENLTYNNKHIIIKNNTKNRNLTQPEILEKPKKKSNTFSIKNDEEMKSLIFSMFEDKELQKLLLDYYKDRRSKRLQPNQWKIILEDLLNMCKSDSERIKQVRIAISAGYMVIIPSWYISPTSKSNKLGNIDRTRKVDNEKSYGEMTREERAKWDDENCGKDENGNILQF